MIDPGSLQNRVVVGNPLSDNDEPRITPSQLADFWGVHTNTVYRDIRKGALPAFRIGSGRQFRIRPSDAKRYGRPVE